MRLLLAKRWSVWGALAVIVATTVGLSIWQQSRVTPSPENRPALLIDLGFDRLAESATFLAYVCAVEGASEAPECVSGQPGDSPQVQAEERPPVLSVGIAEDLVSDDGRRQIPADVFQFTAVNEGLDGLRVTATASGDRLFEVEGGRYVGRVVVQRSAGPAIRLNFVVLADDRDALWPLALWALFVGALLGVLVRWFTDTGGPLSLGYRKLRRLRRLLPAGDRAYLSSSVEDMFQDANESLHAVDSTALEDAVGKLESSLPVLKRRSRSLQEAQHLVARLETIPETSLDEPLRRAIMRVENTLRALLRRERDRQWPWNDPTALSRIESETDQLDAALERIQTNVDDAAMGGNYGRNRLIAIAWAIQRTGAAALLKDVSQEDVTDVDANTERFLAETFRDANGEVGNWLKGFAGDIQSEKQKPSRGEEWASGLVDLSKSIPTVAFVIGVVIVGFLAQVAENQSYDGSPTDALGIWVWAFTVAVTGGTVASLLGKISEKPEVSKAG